jgi:Zn-dependent protease
MANGRRPSDQQGTALNSGWKQNASCANAHEVALARKEANAMFSRAVTIMRVSGIPIRIDASWLIVAVVMTWSLAEMLAEKFPSKTYPELTVPSYWLMAGIVAVGFFICIVLHELGHSLVGQRFGMRIRSITLFVFGGVAELETEPPSAKAEFYMAAAGPVVSVLLAGVFWLSAAVSEAMGWGVSAVAILSHLALLNAVVVGFNMVPAFPLDGGRVLRAILWAIMHSLKRATKVTSRMGQGFGSLMMFFGLFGRPGPMVACAGLDSA